MNEANRPLTLQEAADHVGTSRSRLWRAMSDGHLNVEKRRVAGRNVWTVRESDLIEWAQEFLGGADLALDTETLDAREQSLEHPRTTANVHEQSSEHPRTFVNDHEQSYERPRTSVNNREHSRTNDLPCNPTKKKHVTNHRSATKDNTVILDVPRRLTLDTALEWIAEDELVEVTPKNLRLRKAVLDRAQRGRERKRAAYASAEE